MSGTVMKFGPQWIRTLTDGAAPSTATTSNQNQNSNNTNSTSSSTYSNQNNSNAPSNNSNSNSASNNASSITNSNSGKYKLAEYRYGREEMLALFEPNMEAPEDIRNYPGLYVKEARMPMAMTQVSEEEIKIGTRTWNSEAVLRSASGKAAAAAAAGGGTVTGGLGPNHIGGISGAGISGHSVLNSTMTDRDSRQLSERGAMTAAEVLSSSPRGPPGAMSRVPLSEQRGLLPLSSRGGHPIRNLVSRGANLYMRSQSHDDEGVTSGDGLSSGSTSAGIGGSSGFEGRFGASNPQRQPSSLRARFENSRAAAAAAASGVAGLTASSKPIDIKSGIDSELPPQGRSVFDRLPSKYNADDKLIRKDINGRPLQSDWRSREWASAGGVEGGRPPKSIGPPAEDRSWRSARAGGAQTAEDWRSGSGAQAGSTASATQSSSWYVRSDDQRNLRQHLPQNQENLNPTFGGKRDTSRRPSADEKHGDDDDDAINIQPRHRRDSLPEWSIGDPLAGDKVGSFDASGAFREMPRDEGGNLNNNKMEPSEKQQQQHNQQQPNQQLNQSKRHQDQQQHKEQHIQGNDFEHLERAAEIMVDKWTSEEEQNERKSSSSPDFLRNKSNLSRREQHDAQHANLLHNDNRKTSQVLLHRQEQSGSSDQHSTGSGQAASGTAYETANNQQKLILVPSTHEDAQQWFYRDTQSVIQGPFSANDMYEWYKAGYFVKELLVRRACDELFYPLGDVIKMWDRIPFAPIPMNLAHPPPITPQTILQFRAMAKRLELAASQGHIPPNAYDVSHPSAVLLHGPLLQQQQQQQIHPVLAAASLNQNAIAPPDQQANIRQIIEAATRQQQQRQQQHDPSMIQQQQRNISSVSDPNEMQAQLRQLLVQLKNREGFLKLNAHEQQEVLVRQFVASRTMPQNNVGNGNNSLAQEQEHQALLQQQQRAGMVPFMPPFMSNDQQERIRYQQEIERRQKEEAEKQQQQSRLLMEQRMKAEEEKRKLMEEVQKQRQLQQLEENEKQKQEAEKDRIMKMNQLKQQQLAKQHEEFTQQLQNQQRIQMQQQQEKKQQQQQQQQAQQPQTNQLSTIQQQQQQQLERAKKAAQAHQVQQEQQQQQRKTAWSTVSKPDQEPVSLATLQKLQEEEKEKERERQRQQQAQLNQQQHQQQQQQQQQQIHNFQRQMTWANAAQQSKVAPVKTLAEIQKEEEERLAREKQRKAKAQPVVASAGVWNNAASHLSWKNPPSDA